MATINGGLQCAFLDFQHDATVPISNLKDFQYMSKGGFALVYMANFMRDGLAQTKVAVKVLKPGHHFKPAAYGKFLQEVAFQTAFSHTSVVRSLGFCSVPVGTLIAATPPDILVPGASSSSGGRSNGGGGSRKGKAAARGPADWFAERQLSNCWALVLELMPDGNLFDQVCAAAHPPERPSARSNAGGSGSRKGGLPSAAARAAATSAVTVPAAAAAAAAAGAGGPGTYTDTQALVWLAEVADAMTYLHSRQPLLIHRDLKLENLLLRREADGLLHCKLTDFGLMAAVDSAGDKLPPPQVLRAPGQSLQDLRSAPASAGAAPSQAQQPPQQQRQQHQQQEGQLTGMAGSAAARAAAVRHAVSSKAIFGNGGGGGGGGLPVPALSPMPPDGGLKFGIWGSSGQPPMPVPGQGLGGLNVSGEPQPQSAFLSPQLQLAGAGEGTAGRALQAPAGASVPAFNAVDQARPQGRPSQRRASCVVAFGPSPRAHDPAGAAVTAAAGGLVFGVGGDVAPAWPAAASASGEATGGPMAGLPPPRMSETGHEQVRMEQLNGLLRLGKGHRDFLPDMYQMTFKLTGQCGSVCYMAPEVARLLPYNQKADVYSYGCIMYEVLTRQLLSDGLVDGDADGAMEYLGRVAWSGWRPELPARMPKELRLLVSLAWHREPRLRPNFPTIAARIREVLYAASIGTPLPGLQPQTPQQQEQQQQQQQHMQLWRQQQQQYLQQLQQQKQHLQQLHQLRARSQTSTPRDASSPLPNVGVAPDAESHASPMQGAGSNQSLGHQRHQEQLRLQLQQLNAAASAKALITGGGRPATASPNSAVRVLNTSPAISLGVAGGASCSSSFTSPAVHNGRIAGFAAAGPARALSPATDGGGSATQLAPGLRRNGSSVIDAVALTASCGGGGGAANGGMGPLATGGGGAVHATVSSIYATGEWGGERSSLPGASANVSRRGSVVGMPSASALAAAEATLAKASVASADSSRVRALAPAAAAEQSEGGRPSASSRGPAAPAPREATDGCLSLCVVM